MHEHDLEGSIMQHEQKIELGQFIGVSELSTVPDERLVRKREKVHVIDSNPLLGSGKLDSAKARALALQKMQIRPVSGLTVEA